MHKTVVTVSSITGNPDVKDELSDGADEDDRGNDGEPALLRRFGITKLGQDVLVFLRGRSESDPDPLHSSGNSTLFIDGETVAGDWTIATLDWLDPPKAFVSVKGISWPPG